MQEFVNVFHPTLRKRAMCTGPSALAGSYGTPLGPSIINTRMSRKHRAITDCDRRLHSHVRRGTLMEISISKNDSIATTSNIPTLSSNLPNHADVI